eukprot:CAMPEP_0196654260 /NCGR_PEP_ID=MMETSP1086-20130531/3970_1 /TAXON_ID=77921 /ORGANISM="Cyanoptyche  gloeocystis , Strain SAG4.97" /LENGTH=67 /DNA_ID=CAMNT_0041985923 /DNA_START=37 /DNA_END=238 /DNA_ORIENTATION=+
MARENKVMSSTNPTGRPALERRPDQHHIRLRASSLAAPLLTSSQLWSPPCMAWSLWWVATAAPQVAT